MKGMFSKGKEIHKAFLKSVECSFCSKPLSDPISTLCGHQFCRKCIMDFIKATTKSKCPRCDAIVVIQHLEEDKCLAKLTTLVGNLAKEIDVDINNLGKIVPDRVATKKNKKHTKKSHSNMIRIDYEVSSNSTSNRNNSTSSRNNTTLNRNNSTRNRNNSTSNQDNGKYPNTVNGNKNGVSLLTQIENEHRNNNDNRRKKNHPSRNTNEGSIFNRLKNDRDLRASTAVSGSDYRSGGHVKANNRTYSEDKTSQDGIEELEVETVLVENKSALLGKENTNLKPVGKEMAFDTKVSAWLKNNSKNNNLNDEPEILLEDNKCSSSDEVVNFKSRQLLKTSKLLESSSDEERNTRNDQLPKPMSRANQILNSSFLNNSPVKDNDDPYEFVPSQRPIPMKKGRGRPRKRISNVNRRPVNAKNSRKKVLIEKAEAYHNLEKADSSTSADDDLYRLFITPKITEEDINKLNARKRTTNRKTRGAIRNTKRKLPENRENYNNEIKTMAQEIEDAENFDLTVLSQKRRKVDDKIEEPKNIFKNNAKSAGCIDSIMEVEDLNESRTSVNELKRNNDCSSIGDKSATSAVIICSFSPDANDDIELPKIYGFLSSDTSPNCISNNGAGINNNKQNQNSILMKNNTIENAPVEYENLHEKSVDDIFECTERCSADVEKSIRTNTPQKPSPGKINNESTLFSEITSGILPMSMLSNNNMLKKTAVTEINSPNKSSQNKTHSNSFKVPSPLIKQPNLFHKIINGQLERSFSCEHCGTCVSKSISVVTAGTQTDFEISSTDIIKYPSQEARSFNKDRNKDNVENSALVSDRLMVGEDTVIADTGSQEMTESIVPGSVQTPPRNSLTFDKCLNNLSIKIQEENEENDVEISYSNGETKFSRSVSEVIEHDLNESEDDVFETQALDVELISENVNDDDNKSMEIINDDSDEKDSSIDEEVFVGASTRSKYFSGQSSTPKGDLKSSSKISNIFEDKLPNSFDGKQSQKSSFANNFEGKLSNNLEDEQSQKSFLNIFEKLKTKKNADIRKTNNDSLSKQSPEKIKIDQRKSRTKRGLASKTEINEEKFSSGHSVLNGSLVRKPNLGRLYNPYQVLRGGGSPQSAEKSSGGGLSQELILPTPNSKTGAGGSSSSISELFDVGSTVKRKSVDESGYESMKKMSSIKARKSLATLMEKEVAREKADALEDRNEEGDDVRVISINEGYEREQIIDDQESKLEKLRRKHKMFVCMEEKNVTENEKEVEMKNQGLPIAKNTSQEKRISQINQFEEITDSELMNLDLDVYNVSKPQNQEDVSDQNNLTKKQDALKDEEILLELSKSSNNESPQLSRSKSKTVRKLSSSSESDSSAETIDQGRSSKTKSTCSKRVIEEPEVIERRLSFVASSLTAQEMTQVQNLAKKTDADFRLKFCDETTHVIVKAGEDFITNRTLKYLQGIANKCWIVSYSWVNASLRTGRLQNEEQFEVVGDRIQGIHSGPILSRLSKTPLLLDFEICCLEDFAEISKDDVIALVTTCGANIIFSPAMFGYKPGTIQLMLLQSIPAKRSKQIQDLCNKYGVMAIVRDWALDSISQYRVLSMKNYPHVNPKI